MSNRYCPDCGNKTLRLIEETEPNVLDDEYKEVRTCNACDNIVYIVRKAEERPIEYEVIKLSCIGNDKDGYEVNDAHYTGTTIELPDNPHISEIIKVLKKADVLLPWVNSRLITIDDADNGGITLKRRRNSQWLYELRPVAKN